MGALIKKLCYWLFLFSGETINLHLQSKDTGDTDVFSEKSSSVEYFIWGIKELDYLMKITGTDGAFYRWMQGST